MATTTGRLWTPLESFAVILSPFIEGRNGFEAPLPDRQWVELGAVLRGMHTAVLPLLLSEQIPREEYSPRWRDRVKEFQEDVMRTAFTDPVAAELAAFLRTRQETITDLVGRARDADVIHGPREACGEAAAVSRAGMLSAGLP